MKATGHRLGSLFAPAALLIILSVIISAFSGCKKSEDGQSEIQTTTAPPATAQSTATTAAAETTESPSTTLTAPTGIPAYGWCDASTMHIRSGPGTEYGAIGGLKRGDKVTIVGREGDWFKIEFKEDFGYVSALYIKDTEVLPDPETTPAQTDDTTAPAQ